MNYNSPPTKNTYWLGVIPSTNYFLVSTSSHFASSCLFIDERSISLADLLLTATTFFLSFFCFFSYLIIRNDFWRKKILVKKNFFGLIFKVKFFFTMTRSWTNLDQNLKLLVLGASNIVLRLSEVSEIVSLTPNTI